MRGGDWGEIGGRGEVGRKWERKAFLALFCNGYCSCCSSLAEQLCEFCCLPCSSYVENIHTGYIKNAWCRAKKRKQHRATSNSQNKYWLNFTCFAATYFVWNNWPVLYTVQCPTMSILGSKMEWGTVFEDVLYGGVHKLCLFLTT